jgi:hypothetical protein
MSELGLNEAALLAKEAPTPDSKADSTMENIEGKVEQLADEFELVYLAEIQKTIAEDIDPMTSKPKEEVVYPGGAVTPLAIAWEAFAKAHNVDIPGANFDINIGTGDFKGTEKLRGNSCGFFYKNLKLDKWISLPIHDATGYFQDQDIIELGEGAINPENLKKCFVRNNFKIFMKMIAEDGFLKL